MSQTPDYTATITLSNDPNDPAQKALKAIITYTLGTSTNPAPTRDGSLLATNRQSVRFVVINNTTSVGSVDLVVLPQFCRVNGKSSRGGPFHGSSPNLPGVFYMSTDVPDSWVIQIEYNAAANTYAEYAIVALLPGPGDTIDAVPFMIDPSVIINPT